MKDEEKLLANTRKIKWEVTIYELQRWARQLKLDIDAERQQSGFKEAFQNLHRAFWDWIDGFTPANIRQKIYAADLNCFKTTDDETTHDAEFWREYYQVWRAVFLDGLTHRERHEPKHTKHLFLLAKIALRIDDKAILKAATPPKWNQKKSKPDKRGDNSPFARKLKHCLLIAWLPAGLWRAESRQEQLNILNKIYKDFPSYTPEAINFAQRQFNLNWANQRNTP